MTGIKIWGCPGLRLWRLWPHRRPVHRAVGGTVASEVKDQFKVTQAVRALHEGWYDARWRAQEGWDREQTVDQTSPKPAVRIDVIDWQYPDGRILHAMYLIQTTDLSVTQIAYEVGFVEMLTFEREFKKYTRLTPKEFKHSLRPD